MPPNLGGFFMVRSYYPSECHADYLTLSVSRLLNLLLRLVAFLLFLNPQCLASISRWITASSSWKRFCLFVRSEERFSRNAETDLVCRLLLEKKKRSTARRHTSPPGPRTASRSPRPQASV